MLILSRVCAEFRDRTGAVIFRVTPSTRLTFQEAPESVKEDPLFHLLLSDGSIEAVASAAERKKLEADPLKGADPSGRRTPTSGAGKDAKTGLKPEAKEENQLTKEKKQSIMNETN